MSKTQKPKKIIIEKSNINIKTSPFISTLIGTLGKKKAEIDKGKLQERKINQNKTEENGSKSKRRVSSIIYTRVEDLKPFPDNPRKHSDAQINKLAAIINSYKIISPIVADDDGVILSGHGRLMAAKLLKMKKVPVITVYGLTSDQKRGYVLADNKISELSTWDDELLRGHLELLYINEFDLDFTGFSTPEFERIVFNEELPTPGQSNPSDLTMEDVDPSPVVTIRGDHYQLGRHSLYCGDALQKSSYIKLMQGAAAEMLITDPPYNVPIHGHVCGKGKIKHDEFVMASGELSSSQFAEFLTTAFALIYEFTVKNAVCFSFMDWRHIDEIQAAGRKVFGGLAQLCVWVKDNGGMGTFYRSKHELVFVFRKGNSGHINNFKLGETGRYRTNVWEYPGINSLKGKGRNLLELHPTVKPISMIIDAIRDCSNAGGIILDPFAGSGTTIIAAQLTRRTARAIELDERYCDIIIKRWERISGLEAIHIESGLTFSQLSNQRNPIKGSDGNE